jgi:hypothetical protein
MNKRIVFASVIALFTVSSSVAFADDCSWTPRGGTHLPRQWRHLLENSLPRLDRRFGTVTG